jgi:hypothetical protein
VTGGRHVLLSLAASGLALLLGVVLGAGPVAEQDAAGSAAQTRRLTSEVDELQGRLAGLRESSAADAKAVKALAGPLTGGLLESRSVLVVVSPGAREADVAAVRAALEGAGAAITGTLQLQKAYVDPAKAQSPLEDLSLRLVPPGVDFPDGSLPIDRVGVVLARSTVQAPSDPDNPKTAVDSDAAEVVAGLDELDAIRLDGTPGRLAELAVLVSGPGDDEQARPALVGLLDALDAGSLGAVLTGPGTARSGLLRDVRKEDRPGTDGPSTVDSAGTVIGSTATVLALAEQLAGRSGDYGLGASARRVVPVVSGD